MDPKSDFRCSHEGSGGRKRERVPEWLSDHGSVDSLDQIAASKPFRSPPYASGISHHILDASDSESERFESAISKSEGGNDSKRSRFSEKVSRGHDPSNESPTRRSNRESVKSNLNSTGAASSSKGRHSLRFIPSPHPDMIQRNSNSSESAEFTGNHPVPSVFCTSRAESTRSIRAAENVYSSGDSQASSLSKSGFTFKTARSIGSYGPVSMNDAMFRRPEVEHGSVKNPSPSINVEQISRDGSSSQNRGHHIHVGLTSNISPPVDPCVEFEPAKCDPRHVGSHQRPTLLQNPSSSQNPEFGRLSDVGSVSYVRLSNKQQAVHHHTSNVGPGVGFGHIAAERSSGRSVNLGSVPSSQAPAAQQTRSSSIYDHSDGSYLRSRVSSEHKNSSGSAGRVPSNQSFVDNNFRNPSSSNEGHQIESDSSDARVVLMSLVHKKNKIAGSTYNLSTGQVHLLESVTDSFEFSTTVLALRSVSPSIVVVPSSGAARFVKELKAKIEGDQTLKDCQFQSLSPRYFAYGFARKTILESSLWEGRLTFRSEDAKKTAIVSNINLNDERLVCAFGGLLYHLSGGCPRLGTSPSPITSVQHMKLNNKLWLDTESFKNLQIFDPAEHPSSFKWSSSNRDVGNGIFGLFERFCSSVGMTKLKSFLANPVNCRRTLEKRHEVVDFYLDPNNYNAVEALRSFASQMSSSSVVMGYLSSPTLRGGHWKHIYRHIYYTVSYAEVCRSNGDQSEIFRELGSLIVDAVYSMAHNLERVVDLVNMENNETFVIKYGFHPPLDAAKEKFSRLKTAMDKVTPYEFDSVPPFITKIQMMYIPEMKFLLSVPFWAPDLSKDELNLPNLEFKFTANRTAFYKTRRCYELDELLGDAQTDIINEESMIIQSLRNYLKKHMHHVVVMAQKIAEIECIFALAKVAKEERFTKPDILSASAVEIRGGWHPLLDVPSNEVITNDTVSSADTSLVKLIYGPNASGKSIYLKHVGLIVYLVHVGSYVPAVSARVGLFSRILVRTAVEESVVSMSSTMLSELKKLQDAVMVCAKDTLVILDEVGKGSTETNCIAIVTSAVNYFLSRGSDCPHVMISSHLSGINDFVIPPPHSDGGGNLFELLVMDYVVTDGQIVFLFKIRRCSPNVSFVFEVLENSEFAAPIVKTARTVLEALRTGENFLPYCETRIQRSHKYLNFIRKFVNIDMSKPGYLEKLQHKIQRYYEKPTC